MDDELDDGKGLVLKEIDEDAVDATPVRCMLMNKTVVVDVYVDDEVVVKGYLDTWDGQVDVVRLDVKDQLFDLDVQYTSDALQ